MAIEVASDNGEVTSSVRALGAAKREGVKDCTLLAKLLAIGWSLGALKSRRTEGGILGMSMVRRKYYFEGFPLDFST